MHDAMHHLGVPKEQITAYLLILSGQGSKNQVYFSTRVNFQAQNHSFGCSSGGQAMHSV